MTFFVLNPITLNSRFLCNLRGLGMLTVRETINAFAGNPIIGGRQEKEALESLLQTPGNHILKVLPICDGKPLVIAPTSHEKSSQWHLAWQRIDDIHHYYSTEDRNKNLVYIGDRDGVAYFAIDVPVEDSTDREEIKRLANVFGQPDLIFFDLRTLMQASDWANQDAMGELSIAGHARAMIEWHKQAAFCGRCGSSTGPILCGQKRQCANVNCNHKLYPRIDPVVIMLVIDKERDCAILARQSRFVPRMWSCLAGFIEPGESLEDAVRRETREEVGIEVGDIVYHSSQPWPVGPSSMSCQLMIGFFAYAKTFHINVDKKELEDARWYPREQIRNSFLHISHKKNQLEATWKIQKAAATTIEDRKIEKLHKSLLDVEQESSETSSPVFVPGPYAIAHHLILSWVNQSFDLLQSNY